jgi:hypothetical protein
LNSLLENKPEGKVYFTGFVESGMGLFILFHKEDRLILLKAVLKVSRYNDNVMNIINIKISNH